MGELQGKGVLALPDSVSADFKAVLHLCYTTRITPEAHFQRLLSVAAYFIIFPIQINKSLYNSG